MLKKMSAAVVGLSFLVSVQALAQGRNHCLGGAKAAVKEEGFTGAYHVHTDVMTVGQGSRVTGYMFWFQQPQQRGYVVVNTTETCYVTDVYTRMR